MPLLWALAIGQAQALVTLLLTYGTPFGVALAANLKVFPGLAAIYWVGRRDWRRLGLFAGVDGRPDRVPVRPAAGGHHRVHLVPSDRSRRERPEPVALRDLTRVVRVSVVVMALVALRLANTRWGWPAAVVLTVFATPRLLSYQMSTLLAAFRPPDPPREEEQPATGPTPLATP